jgi:hypothetical protein
MAPTHPVDEKPPLPRLIALGLQHVLVMYAGAVAVPPIIGGALQLPKEQIAFLSNADLFACGIVTLPLFPPVVTGTIIAVIGMVPLVADKFFSQMPACARFTAAQRHSPDRDRCGAPEPLLQRPWFARRGSPAGGCHHSRQRALSPSAAAPGAGW